MAYIRAYMHMVHMNVVTIYVYTNQKASEHKSCRDGLWERKKKKERKRERKKDRSEDNPQKSLSNYSARY